MGMNSVFGTGRSGMMAAKSALTTTGHNISNANTEGYSRQRVELSAQVPVGTFSTKPAEGRGVLVSRVDRSNDEYLEKQLRTGNQELSHFEEKDVHLGQLEDIFNEMNGDGLNRLVSNFFNQFRKLANDPDSEAVRQSVREASQSMITDFKRLREEVMDVAKHIDSRLDGYVREVNSLVDNVKDLNFKVQNSEAGGSASANDLRDQRDVALKKLAGFMNIATVKDNQGNISVDIPGLGPIITPGHGDKFSVERSPADGEGKIEGTLDLRTSATANSVVTHRIKGGKIGALLEVRDKTISSVLDRLDDLAFNITQAVNDVHTQGFTRTGAQGVEFFKTLPDRFRAAEYMDLSDPIKANTNNIAAAASPHAPGDNRVAIALSGIQGLRLMNGGKSTADDWYNSIVSDVGIVAGSNKASLNQTKSVMTQMQKMRDQLSGVSLDEETANLLQFQHAFDANAKVIQVANDMMDTVMRMGHV